VVWKVKIQALNASELYWSEWSVSRYDCFTSGGRTHGALWVGV
jgi:hypothetical protein